MGRSYAPSPVFQFFGDDGKPLVFGFLCTYVAGTNTPVATYDSDGKPNEVKMRLNGRGETDTAIMLDADMAYKFVLLRPDGSEIWTRDNVTASGSSGTAGTDISAEHPITKKMVGSTALIGFDSTDLDKALSAETKAREEADRSIYDSLSTIGGALSTETTERKEADAELAKAIAGKQSPLQDGDNIHIDEDSRINVVDRKTLAVESPLTVQKTDTQLILGIRSDAFATTEELEAGLSGKQDGLFVFNSSSSTHDEVLEAITSGRTIVSGTGSSFATWQGAIVGAVANLFRVSETEVFNYYYSFGSWAFRRYSLATANERGRLTLPLNGTEAFSYGDWTFAFSVNSINAAVVNVKNEKATSADIFSETRTYGNTVRLVGEDLSSGKDIVYCGNGDFQSIPARIVMDIRTETEWIELRMLQFTSGSNLVIDYRIGGANG